MVFGERLRTLREKRGWTQQDLADRLNISRNTVAGYESKGKIPREDTLISIADIFGVSTDYLLGRIDDPRPYFYEDEDAEEILRRALAIMKTDPYDREKAMNNVRKLMKIILPEIAGKPMTQSDYNIIMANITAVIEAREKE